MKNYYKVLGVLEQATDEEIKSAYRKLAKKYHPDVVKGDKTKEARMYEIQEAYQCLGDQDKRNVYEEARKKSHAGFKPGAGTSDKRQYPKGGQPNPDMSQFEQFFGFQPGKGMETYREKRDSEGKPVGPVKPEEMFASFFGRTGQKGGRS